jgi:hypothetical protein
MYHFLFWEERAVFIVHCRSNKSVLIEEFEDLILRENKPDQKHKYKYDYLSDTRNIKSEVERQKKQ